MLPFPGGPRLYSIRYERRDQTEFVTTLAAHGIEVLVDVRLNPRSRRPGFSKRQLADALAGAGIAYVHEPTLGNQRDNRAAFAAPDGAGRDRLRAQLRDEGHEALMRLAERARHHVVAVMCLERRADHCHRRVVTEKALRLAPALDVVELT